MAGSVRRPRLQQVLREKSLPPDQTAPPHSARRALVALALCALAGPALAQPIELVYTPAERHLRIVVPLDDPDAAGALDAPDWLTPAQGAAEGSVAFEGTLPPPGDVRGLGATATDAYLLGALGWIPAGREGPRELVLSAPRPHRGVATGALVAEALSGEDYTARFQPYGPPGDLGVFFGPYSVDDRTIELTDGEATLRTYFAPPQATHSSAYLEAAERHVARYDTSIGAYPYAGFSMISAPIPVGYGLPGATYIAEQILGHPYMLGRSLAHEVLHAWWGGAVGVDYETGNWAEGLTTYQADHALAEERAPAAAREMRRDWLAALTSLPAGSDRPVRSFVSAGHDQDQSVGYGKTAMIFHMLRLRLGDAAFDAAMAAFYAEHRGRVAGWPDLQAAFEDASAAPLDRFFAQWLDRGGLPRVRPLGARATTREGRAAVSVALQQNAPFYELDLPVVVETEAGPVTEIVRLDGASTTAEIAVPAPAVSVAVDPDFDVARELLAGELPLTLRDVVRAGSHAVLAGRSASGPATAIAGALLRGSADLTRAPLEGQTPDADAVIAVGETDEVAAFRTARLPGKTPRIARQGDSRAWVERDADGRIWLFASADRVSALTEELASLRYYGGQSFVVVDGEARPRSGRWPVEDSPMRIALP